MGYIAITNREWFNYLKETNKKDNVNFWRKNTNDFKVISKGDKFFFLVKNKIGNKDERKVLGYGIFREYVKLTIDEAWNKYGDGNGCKSKQDFINIMSTIYMENLSEAFIGCIILDDIIFFEHEVLLSEVGIEFQKSIVSGKGISKKEDLNIIEKSEANIRKDELYNLNYEKEVISIPASGTIDLIYKYKIHAHPDKSRGYSYKNAVYYTFRETNGIMKVLYTLEQCIILNPKKDYSIVLDNMNITEDIKKRIINYIEERKRIYGFDYDGNYKIYILNGAIKLKSPKKFSKSLRNHTYSKIEYFFYNDNIINTIKNEDINLIDDSEFYEGNMITIKQNKYERNTKARRECLKHYGYKCQICGFDFEEFYGEIGKDIIEVHHRKALSEIKENYTVDPIRDLVPVCSNCHTIIHSRKPYYTVEELKSILDFKK